MRSLATLLGAVLLAACGSTPEPVESEGVVTGAVLDEKGKPLASVVVTLRDPTTWKRHARTDKDGKYRFERVPYGPAYLESGASGRLPARRRISVRAGQAGPHILTLLATRTITGLIRFEGRSVEGAVVEATPQDGGLTETGWSDADGKYLVGGLKPGVYDVSVQLPPDLRDAEGAYIAQAGVPPVQASAGAKGVDIDIPTGARVRVQAKEGVLRIEGKGLRTRRYDIGREGTLVIRGLLPGEFTFVLNTASGSAVQFVRIDKEDGRYPEYEAVFVPK